MDRFLVRHVLERAGDVERQREKLLEAERAAPANQPPQRRTLEMLDDEMRHRPVEHRVEAADDHGVRQSVEDLGLLAQLA